MPSNRIGRINEEIQRELSDLLRTVKDPRVQKTMVSVTRVDTTSDLRYAKVYISIYDKEQSKEVMKGLKAAGGFLRHELANRLSLRHTPELVWTEDNSITYGARIMDILSTLDIPKDNDEGSEDVGGGVLDAPNARGSELPGSSGIPTPAENHAEGGEEQ
ncbi:MAG: 30S ribosome-binding factor RbfA [Oscillospiraceae bacterium]|nr:30S ribosome-binding factor RbfA [Oscillospiraceae bacterium]